MSRRGASTVETLLALASAGAAAAGAGLTWMVQQVNGHGFISSEVLQAVIGFLLILTGYLFKASRDHDKLTAALDERTKRAREEIDQLLAEARTVDKRIEESRHLMRNVVSEVVSDFQLRTDDRMTKMEGKLDNLMGLDAKLDTLTRFLVQGGGKTR